MLRARSVLYMTVVLAVMVAACNVQPPTRPITRRATPSVAAEYVGLPSVEESRTVQEMWQKGYLKYGTPLAVPYTFIKKGPGEFRGIIPDLAFLVGKLLGFPSPLVQLQRWPQMPKDLESGILPMIIGGPASRPEFEGLEFVQVGERGYCLVARADDDRFHEVEDILKPGVVFAAVQGTDGQYHLLTNYPGVELKRKPVVEAEDIIQEVLAGEADVTYVYSLVTPLFLESYPELKAFPADCAEHPLWSVPWGFSILPDPVLRQFLEELVATLRETGWLEERREKWLDPQWIEEALILEE